MQTDGLHFIISEQFQWLQTLCIHKWLKKSPRLLARIMHIWERTLSSGIWKLWRAPTTLILQPIQETEIRWQHSLSQLRTSKGWKSKCLSWMLLWIPLNQISCSYFSNLKHNWHCSLLICAWFSTLIVLDVRMDFAEDSGGVITSWGDMHCMSSSQMRSSCFCARLEPSVRIKVTFHWKAFFSVLCSSKTLILNWSVFQVFVKLKMNTVSRVLRISLKWEHGLPKCMAS